MAAVGSCCLLRAISADTLCVASLGGYRAVVGRRVVGGVVAVAERLSAEHNTASEKLRTELVALHLDDGQSVVHTRGAWRLNGIIQDVAASIMPFSKKSLRSMCVLFANGTISNVALNQPGSSGSNFTYEIVNHISIGYFWRLQYSKSSNTISQIGRFEILQLSASFTVAEEDGRRRSGRFCFSLAGPNGCVIGGVVAGTLRAASPIQFSLLRKRQKLPISKELKIAQPITAAKELACAIEKRVLSLGKAAYQELTGVKKLKLDEQGVLHWPVLLLYPKVMSSDFIEDFPETDFFLSPSSCHVFRKLPTVGMG